MITHSYQFEGIFKRQVEAELTHNILPFWMTYTVDCENGGFYGEISNDLKINKTAPKGLLLTSRILWTFSKAYQVYRKPAYLATAKWAYYTLINTFLDVKHGGYYWTVSYNGWPLNTTKEIFGQSLVIYALVEYFKATHHHESLQLAIELFYLLETKAHDDKYGGYIESFSREWNYNPNSIISGGHHNAVKSDDTHINMMEAYTSLFKVWKHPLLQKTLEELILILLHTILNSSYHLTRYFTRDWSPVSKGIAYGHDIKFSWLIIDATQVLGKEHLCAEAKKAAVQMAVTSLKEAIDPLDGGMYYAKDEDGRIQYKKHWWLQAEAVVGFLNAYQISHHPVFLTSSYRSWCFIKKYIVDHIYGEWFEEVNKEGIPQLHLPKVSVWKGPLHGSRASFEVMRRTFT